jgi:serine/threonine protein phosphatase 1
LRTIAIGDIHGCTKALIALLEAIRPFREDTLVFLGDYVDRGPDSRGTIDCLLTLQSKCQTIFLRGNHEIALQGYLDGVLAPDIWHQLGGRSTLVSYGGRTEGIPEEHRQFIRACVPYYENKSHLFVHANYDPSLALGETPERTLFWEHLHERLPGPHISNKTVWLGHTPQLTGQVLDLKHLVCLDTFCFGTGYLTAIDVDSREAWQANKEGHLRRQPSAWYWSLRRWWKSHRNHHANKS